MFLAQRIILLTNMTETESGGKNGENGGQHHEVAIVGSDSPGNGREIQIVVSSLFYSLAAIMGLFIFFHGKALHVYEIFGKLQSP